MCLAAGRPTQWRTPRRPGQGRSRSSFGFRVTLNPEPKERRALRADRHRRLACSRPPPPAGDHERNLAPAVVRPSTHHSLKEPAYNLLGAPLHPEVRPALCPLRACAGRCRSPGPCLRGRAPAHRLRRSAEVFQLIWNTGHLLGDDFFWPRRCPWLPRRCLRWRCRTLRRRLLGRRGSTRRALATAARTRTSSATTSGCPPASPRNDNGGRGIVAAFAELAAALPSNAGSRTAG